jgi:hypothetical protein
MKQSNKILFVSIFLIFLTISTALAELSIFEISKDIKKKTLTEVIHKKQLVPLLVMLWGINCKALLPFGLKKDQISKSFIVANEIQALLSQDPIFNDSTERSSMPLFILFDQNRKVVKIWTASILENFITQVKTITGK